VTEQLAKNFKVQTPAGVNIFPSSKSQKSVSWSIHPHHLMDNGGSLPEGKAEVLRV
jgi:hypothetical protein